MNNRVNNSVMMECLEDRVFNSVTTSFIAAAPLRTSHAIVSANRIPQVTGTWSGTCKIATNRKASVVGMTLGRQRGATATGTFFGPVCAKGTVVSSAVVGADRSFRVVLQGKNFYGSITATISRNGQQIIGRWCCNGPSGWQVGTLVMNRIA